MSMNTDTIKKTLEELLTHLGVAFDEVEVTELFGQPLFRIKTQESKHLIGTRGNTLRALTHIIKNMFRDSADGTRFMIDINDYKTKKITAIQDTAQMLAQRALSLKYDVEMQPMSSYERMIVHNVLTDIEDIETSSIGEGRERRVVIKYTGV